MRDHAFSFRFTLTGLYTYFTSYYYLYQKGAPSKKLKLRELRGVEGDVEVFVANLSQFRVGSVEDVLRLLRLGGAERAVRSTAANARSSRSHW